MSAKKIINSLNEQLAGAKKRNKQLIKASKNSHEGMLHWKAKSAFLQLEIDKLKGGMAVIDQWINQNTKNS